MPAPRRFLRPALAAALCLAGGAAATVAVAWGFSAWGTVSDVPLQEMNVRMCQYAPEWCRSHLQHLNAEFFTVSWQSAGLSDREAHVEWQFTRLPAGSRVLMLHRAGWPMCALRTVWEWAPTSAQPAVVLESGLAAPIWLTRPQYQTGRSAWLLRRPPLPLGPEPLGFAADTLFYAAILSGLFVAPRPLRRVIRRRRGLCPRCAYSLSGLPPGAPCPECGKPA